MENAKRILEDLTLQADLEKKCEQIEEALRTGASMSKITNKSEPKYPGEDQQYLVLQSLLHQRRSSTTRGEERTRLSKLIQKEIKAIKNLQRRSQISMILDKFRGLREISSLKSRKKKTLIASITDKNGGECTDRQGIADVFADFYADLYGSRM